MLRAGAAVVDITPELGVHLSGSGAGNHRPAQSVLDPLCAKAVIFESAECRVCIIALDATIITSDYTERIRAAVCERFGFEREAILVHATQTHSAPSLGHFMLDPDFPLSTTPENEYLRGAETPNAVRAADRAVDAVGAAVERLQPVQLATGRGIVGDISFNRRGVRRDGSIIMPKPQGRTRHPLGQTDLCFVDGPIDPEVGVLCAQNRDLEMVAMLLHFTCHPVNVFGHPHTSFAVSADWPGAWSAGMQAHYGAAFVPLVLNGCCGDINPWHPYDPDAIPDHEPMGRTLTEMGRRIVHSLTFSDCPVLDWRVEHVGLPYRDIPPGRLAEAEQLLAGHTEPPRGADRGGDVDPDWFRAASTKSVDYCRKREPEFMYEIQAFRIGDTVILGLPGEPFVEGQLEIKTASPAPFVFVAHMTSHYVGYLPTRDAFRRGGHEANEDCTYWAKLAPEALDIVVERTRRLVAGLF